MRYYVTKIYKQPLNFGFELEKDIIDSFKPPTHISTEYKNWISMLDVKTCFYCREMHGQVFDINEIPHIMPPLHEKCRCLIEVMKAVFVGAATQDGENGADVYLKMTGTLPNYYITKKQANKAGWINAIGNLNVVAPGKVIGGDIYKNRNSHLPSAPNRIWYEADINYDKGYLNGHRLIYSNDGLIFATYDHYKTFIQVH